MKKYLKPFINGILASIGLKVSRVHPGILSGINLFTDLRFLINGQSPVCLDVGANQGQTIENLQQSLNNPYIYSFEPSSNVFEILKGKEFSDHVYLFNYALGAKEQELDFINYEGSCLSSFLPLDGSEENRFREMQEKNREKVKINTVDSFLSQQHIRKIDLLKTDTQGFDLDVLKGAEESLESGIIDYVLVEINFVRMYEGQATAHDIIDFLGQKGMYLIDYYEKVRQNNTFAWCTALFGKR